MDIEEYLEKKRSLEAKKELLEAKERLKDDTDRKKRELDKEKKKVMSEKPGASEDERVPAGAPDFYKRMVILNVLVLVIVIGLLVLAYFFLFAEKGELDTSSNLDTSEVTGSTVIETEEEDTTQEESEEELITEEEINESEGYPGPEFLFFAEDIELGPFDSTGKLGGENLVITSSYYKDVMLTLQNKDSAVIKCFIDREVSVDDDGDGKDDLSDHDLDFIVDEIDPLQKSTFKESLPGSFDQGTYGGEGKITAVYESRCYYCIDPDCESFDKNGESVDSVKVKFQASPGASP